MSIVGAILDILAKIAQKLPIQDRKERWKNQLASLKKERTKLLKGEANEKKANRLIAIDNRINELNRLLENSSDSD